MLLEKKKYVGIALLILIASNVETMAYYTQCGPISAKCNCSISVFQPLSVTKYVQIMKCQFIEHLTIVSSNKDVLLDLTNNELYNLDKVLYLALERTVVGIILQHNKFQYLKPNSRHQLYKNSWNDLKYLDFSHNNIKTIGTNFFNHLSHITHLILRDNKLSNLQEGVFMELNHLQHLDLSNNPLKTIQFDLFNGKYPTNFTHWNLSQCQLYDVDEATFRSTLFLTDIDLSHNELTFINSNAIRSIQMQNLNLSYNRFESVPVQALQTFRRLHNLYLDGNPILRLGKHDVSQVNATIISISYSLLTVVHSNVFHSLPYLQELHLSHNRKLNFLHRNAFGKIPSLRQLDLSYNHLHVIPDISDKVLKLELNIINNPLWCVCDNEWIGSKLQYSSHRKIVLLFKDLLTCRHYEKVTPSRGLPFTLAENKHFRNLTVNYNCKSVPKILHPLSSSRIELTEQDTAILECLTTGIPKPDIYWLFPNESLNLENPYHENSNERIQIRDGLLQLNNARVSDSGKYTCVAFNNAKRSRNNDKMSYIVMVHSKQLELVVLTTGTNYARVTWRGVARHHAEQYCIGYRELDPLVNGLYHTPFNKIYPIRHSWRSFTAHRLKPAHTYQICLVHNQARHFYSNNSQLNIHNVGFPLVFRQGQCVQVDTKYSIEHLYGHGIYRMAHHSTVYMMLAMVFTICVLSCVAALVYQRKCKKLHRIHKQNRYSTIGIRKGDSVQLEVLLDGHSTQYNSKTSLLSHNSSNDELITT